MGKGRSSGMSGRAVFAAAGLILAVLVLTGSSALSASLEGFRKSTFKPYVNDTFRMEAGSELVEVKLVEVTGKKTRRMESFSLVFRGPAENPLGQGTYTMEHPELGVFPLFVVPIGQDGKGIYYQAVFNRPARRARSDP